MLALSVVICTHNPKADYLERTLASLTTQSLPRSDWELLVVDNASTSPIAAAFSVDWHPNGRHLSEPKLGKTNAVLYGMRHSGGELVMLVDDDNVLDPDYLEQAVSIGREWPCLGTWGGSIRARYETPPPDWIKSYECYLSVREVDRDYWFNLTRADLYGAFPYGAGLCVRRNVAEQYSRLLEKDEMRRNLDRKGASLVSSGDTDLALVGCEMGLGSGVFRALRLEHLIRKERLDEAYMERMLREMGHSIAILAATRGHYPVQSNWPAQLWRIFLAWRRGPRELKFHRASVAGTRTAAAVLNNRTANAA